MSAPGCSFGVANSQPGGCWIIVNADQRNVGTVERAASGKFGAFSSSGQFLGAFHDFEGAAQALLAGQAEARP